MLVSVQLVDVVLSCFFDREMLSVDAEIATFI